MNSKRHPPIRLDKTNYLSIGLIIGFVWTALIGSFLGWGILQEKQETVKLAKIEALASFNKDLVYRRWASAHGGLYVPVTEHTPPNPYLSHIPERDIITPSGKKLTLINPAYMTRQVHELAKEQYSVKGHITSLNPIRPQNAPDQWERAALGKFEHGVAEVMSVDPVEGIDHLRLMRPMIVEIGCLKCHADQGYSVGDIRGGISVSVPMTSYVAVRDKTIHRQIATHGLTAILGWIGITVCLVILKRRSEQRLLAENALIKSEHLLREAQNTAKVAHFSINTANGEYLLADEFYRILGLDPTRDKSADLLWRHIHPEDKGPIAEAVFGQNSSRENMECDARFITQPGNVIHAHIIIHVKRNSLGDAELIWGTLQDVTERKRIEDALKVSEKRHRTLFDEVIDGIALVDANTGVIKDCNKALANMMATSKRKMIGQSEACLHRGGGDSENDPFELGKALGKRLPVRSTLVTESGEKKHVEIRCSKLTLDQKNYLLAIYRDVTEHIRIETRLKQAQKIEAIGTLAGGIAHDFNNLLFPILGFSELLLEDLPESSPSRENAQEIFKASLRAKDLVRQILTFSHQTEDHPAPIPLQPIIGEVVSLLKATIPKTITIRSCLAEACGLVYADKTQIHQVIMNLATNAYHAMEKEGGLLSIHLKMIHINEEYSPLGMMQSGEYALISVSDTGCGMDSETLDRIFDPYFTTKGTEKGTGLGLSIVRGIVVRCGGEIVFYSEPGTGTVANVYLPIHQGQSSEVEAMKSFLPTGSERILLVDDEPAIIKLASTILKRLGYTVSPYTSSKEAARCFRNDPDGFDLILTDMTMPDMTGLDLVKVIKELRPDIPVVICTGFSDQIDPEKSQSHGISEFIMKPIIRKDLAMAVRNALDRIPNTSGWRSDEADGSTGPGRR